MMGRTNFAEERTPSLTFKNRVLKSCQRPIRYLIYNKCLCKFTHNSAKSFKVTKQKKNHV